MTVTDIAAYNADWLKAWTDKDVDRLCAFYAEDCVYKDPQTAAGVTGHAPLGAYLTGLFAATPPMRMPIGIAPPVVFFPHSVPCGPFKTSTRSRSNSGKLCSGPYAM